MTASSTQPESSAPDLAALWSSARRLHPIYVELAREFVIEAPAFAALDEPVDAPDRETVEQAQQWLHNMDDRIQVHQLRQFLQTSSLVDNARADRSVKAFHRKDGAHGFLPRQNRFSAGAIFQPHCSNRTGRRWSRPGLRSQRIGTGARRSGIEGSGMVEQPGSRAWTPRGAAIHWTNCYMAACWSKDAKPKRRQASYFTCPSHLRRSHVLDI